MKSLQELAEKYVMLGYYLEELERYAGSQKAESFVWASEGFLDGLQAVGAIKSNELMPLVREVRKKGVQS